MKFSLYLSSHLTPEWQSQYVHYDKMKKMIYEKKSHMFAYHGSNDHDLHDDADVVDAITTFLNYCKSELTKVDVFYSEKSAEAKRKFENIKTEINNYIEESNSVLMKRYVNRRRSKFKSALSEFYLLLILIQNYQNLNYTAFRKILKKFDKEIQTDEGHKWLLDNVENAYFNSSRDIDALIEDVEVLFIEKLEDGNRSKAMQRLRVLPLEEKEKSGCILLSQLQDNTRSVFVPWKPGFHLYRSFFILVVHTILLGINVYGWNKVGVNHVLIFELDPRHHCTYQQIIEIFSFIGIIILLSVISFIVGYHFSLNPFMNPLIFFVFVVVFLLNPINIFKRSARFWLIKRILRLSVAPFCYVPS
ncbi:hypothetical protein GJ496_003005 [Pomphorhynchus laevis]|nr:hypothetical protein GJ496_003005 [Pomphorhynchus laevis]